MVEAERVVDADLGRKPIPFSLWEQRQLAAIQDYMYLGGGPRTPELTYVAGLLYFQHNQVVEATELLRLVIRMDPGAPRAEDAALLLLEGFALLEDSVRLRLYAKSFYDQPGLGSPEFKAQVLRIYESAEPPGEP